MQKRQQRPEMQSNQKQIPENLAHMEHLLNNNNKAYTTSEREREQAYLGAGWNVVFVSGRGVSVPLDNQQVTL